MSDSIFTDCAAQYNTTDQMMDLIECVSNGNQETTDSLIFGVNTFWLIYGGALVFFMQIGFAMLCAGCIRAKNVKNVILWNLLDSCGGGVAFWTVGYAFAYGGDAQGEPKTFIGNTSFFLRNNDVDLSFFFFQWAFSCALSSIVAGAIAERTKMAGYLLYSSFLCGFVYPVVAHAVWSYNGFLSNLAVDPLFGVGVVDLAGSGPVHLCGGVAALAGTLVLGPRRGRFHDENGNPLETPKEIIPHSTALIFLGTFCLWFGWYGFNPASTLKITNQGIAETAALAATNTTLAACTGALSALYLSTLWSIYTTGVASWDCLYACNGCLCGLVAITAPCATVPTWAGVVIGAFAGFFYLLASKTLLYLRIDDAVDAVPVHMVSGAWGVFATGLFTRPDLLERAFAKEHAGLFFGGGGRLLAAQVVSIIFIFFWTFTLMMIFFFTIKVLGLYRADPLEEEVGLDISRHNGPAYDNDGGAAKEEDIHELNKSRGMKFDAAPDSTEKEVEGAGEVNA